MLLRLYSLSSFPNSFDLLIHHHHFQNAFDLCHLWLSFSIHLTYYHPLHHFHLILPFFSEIDILAIALHSCKNIQIGIGLHKLYLIFFNWQNKVSSLDFWFIFKV